MKLAKKYSTYLVICLGKVLHARWNPLSFECQPAILCVSVKLSCTIMCNCIRIWDP
ncbi:hypothetical protein M5D96_005842 [Drosophila gunungcola]|uniref:Uncharacterized protein n=1 Tax=Drosophila gunungcola TaxID=103775 RepID=A0A9P9YR76_9MUSC|nr:hypothetical protein M5D96_005842 [Drosophila gunungcola]